MITKAQNKKRIIIYLALGVIVASIGLFSGRNEWLYIATAFFVLAAFRKFWLDKKISD